MCLDSKVLIVIKTSGDSSLLLELLELPRVPVTLSTEGQLPRPIDLVTGHTYQIRCRDTADSGRFDDQELVVWEHDGIPVPKLSPGEFPEGSVRAVYASSEVSFLANEWTLVLQLFGEGDEGVYRCNGLNQQVIALDIREGKTPQILEERYLPQ